MGLGPITYIIRSIGLALVIGGGLAGLSPAQAGSVPPAGSDWQIVNSVFADAVRQQTIQNRGFLPDNAFQPAYGQPLAPVHLPNQSPAMAKAGKSNPPAQKAPSAETAQMPPSKDGKWGWLSEARLGILMHSAPISTSTPKEKGVDGNLEVLFTSPGWLNWLWSPRPHIGASFNASSDDTDQLYAGLTWEWEPLQDFFIDASFGFSGHNGRLHIDGADEDSGRRREFGCKVLFRESLELGYRLTKRHSLSAIWDHISHGGLCDDENEGMDNAGIRYGYRY
jgi:lipid A 3-O-deacylase